MHATDEGQDLQGGARGCANDFQTCNDATAKRYKKGEYLKPFVAQKTRTHWLRRALKDLRPQDVTSGPGTNSHPSPAIKTLYKTDPIGLHNRHQRNFV
jgi:hypothetical protein